MSPTTGEQSGLEGQLNEEPRPLVLMNRKQEQSFILSHIMNYHHGKEIIDLILEDSNFSEQEL